LQIALLHKDVAMLSVRDFLRRQCALPALLLLGLAAGSNCQAGTIFGHSDQCGVTQELCGEGDCCEDPCCDLDSCSGLGCGETGLMSGLLSLNPFQGTPPCFDDFISPMSNPVFFEDPRTVSELRPMFVHHNIPAGAGGGHANVIALQIRAAITERLSLIATKDGFIMSTNDVVDDGWADVSLGLKYGLIQDVENQRLLSAGLTFELPVGTPRALQGNGDGEFNLFLTGGLEFLERWHFLSATGFRLPTDTSAENQVWYWSGHIDRKFGERFYGLVEMNWYHYMSNGNAGIPGIGGGDFFNLGSPGIAGDDMATVAFGTKFKPSANTELGVAYEIPMTSREDLMRNRTTVDFILRF
jgi:hypothetical protein